jgi:hypothetical protein
MGETLIPTVVLAVVITAVSVLEIGYRKRRRKARIDWLKEVLGGSWHVR